MIQSSKGPKVSSDHPLGKQRELTSPSIHEWPDIFGYGGSIRMPTKIELMESSLEPIKNLNS